MLSTQHRWLVGAAAAAAAASPAPARADAVTVWVRVTAAALEVSAASPTLDPEALEALAITLPWSPGAQDPDELRELSLALHDIKRRHEDSERLVIVPEIPLSYPELLDLMDAARVLSLSSGSEQVEATLSLFTDVALEPLVIARQ